MDSTFDKLTRFCLYRERCTYEVLQKMYTLEVKDEDKPRFLHQLREEKYLDDERFIKAFINSRVYLKKWGKTKIRQELSMKKLDKESIKKELMLVDDELYISNLHHLAERKWNALHKKPDRDRRASLFRYLSGKGYESDLISDWLKQGKKD